jgi:hypothetical protein
MPGIRVRVSNTAELRRLGRRLRAAGSGGLQRDLAAGIRREGRPVLGQIKSSVRGLEVGSERGGIAPPDTSTGLRGRLAAATTVQTQGTGVRYEVHGARVDPRYGHRLAKLSDTELAPRWRHPVFGNRQVWKTNVGRPWFFVTIRGAEGRFAGAVRRAMQVTANKIMG